MDRRVTKAGMVWYGKKVVMRVAVLNSWILKPGQRGLRQTVQRFIPYRNLRINHSTALMAGIRRNLAPTKWRKASTRLSRAAFSSVVI